MSAIRKIIWPFWYNIVANLWPKHFFQENNGRRNIDQNHGQKSLKSLEIAWHFWTLQDSCVNQPTACVSSLTPCKAFGRFHHSGSRVMISNSHSGIYKCHQLLSLAYSYQSPLRSALANCGGAKRAEPTPVINDAHVSSTGGLSEQNAMELLSNILQPMHAYWISEWGDLILQKG